MEGKGETNWGGNPGPKARTVEGSTERVPPGPPLARARVGEGGPKGRAAHGMPQAGLHVGPGPYPTLAAPWAADEGGVSEKGARMMAGAACSVLDWMDVALSRSKREGPRGASCGGAVMGMATDIGSSGVMEGVAGEQCPNA